ncbi:TadA family conjugal transfer-associated ATPase [Brachybacterium hainanense]|uniref:TadA family conjugal transfer-associated ATPase n=1 Tax=Brachybacterium hainanense TaxID=1541174 RepID=A0ABV6RGU0_9MICO
MEELIDLVRDDLVRVPGPVDVPRIARLLREAGQVVGAAELLRTTSHLRDHLLGLGPLQELLTPTVTDILVNGDGSVWVDTGEGLERSDLALAPEQARELAVRLATVGGRRLDDAVPYVDAHLPDGARLHAVLPPLSTGATLLSLRLPARHGFDLDALSRAGTFGPLGREVLEAVVASRLAFVVSGGTGTGKSTVLAAMLARVPRHERIVIVEDAQELDVDHPHAVGLQSRHPNAEGAGAVDLSVLVRQCLRMRPDRIVLGECRGAEVRELLQALNTGHEGGCGTLHANTAADVPARLESLGALGGLDPRALASQAASALDVVIHLGRAGRVRRLEQVAVLHRGRDGELATTSALDLRGGEPVAGPAWDELASRLGLSASPAGRGSRRARR